MEHSLTKPVTFRNYHKEIFYSSWLQRDPQMKVRTNYQPYLDRVKLYFDALLAQVDDLLFTRGGPIIATQVQE